MIIQYTSWGYNSPIAIIAGLSRHSAETPYRIADCTSEGYNDRMSDTTITQSQPDHEKSDEVLTPVGATSYAHDKAKILARLRRMEGQVRGVQRMVEGDEYCLDVLTQLSAVIAAARGIGLLVLEDHVRGCVANALRAEDDDETHQDEIMADLMGAIDRFGRSVG